ncbi:MAG: hypothetical protein M1828_000620 [Chrysothrix sp. TS-e1954]|nr:MAG: hypothetical protein M1828_000620 [Chrysothrix sp. TS-e1954]
MAEDAEDLLNSSSSHDATIPNESAADDIDDDEVKASVDLPPVNELPRDDPQSQLTQAQVDGGGELDAAGGGDPTATQQPRSDPPEVEARIPQKKDATLREFLGKMDDCAPIIPDAVVDHYLTLAGLPPPPQTSRHLARLLALATQKFVSDVAADAYQYARIRSSHTTSNTGTAMALMGAGLGLPGQGSGPAGGTSGGATQGGPGGKEADKGKALGVPRAGYGGGGQGGSQGRTVLTMEDLGMAVGEYGVNVRRGEFYR